METFAKVLHTRFMVLTAHPMNVATHFMGRTLVCGDAGRATYRSLGDVVEVKCLQDGPSRCRVCDFERARMKRYLLIVVQQKVELLEACGSLSAAIDQAHFTQGLGDGHGIAGLIVEVKRSVKRAAWRLVGHDFRPELTIARPDRELLALLSGVFRLPEHTPQEDRQAWLQAAADAHRTILSRGVVPGLIA